MTLDMHQSFVFSSHGVFLPMLKRLLGMFIILLSVMLLSLAGWFVYTTFLQTTSDSVAIEPTASGQKDTKKTAPNEPDLSGFNFTTKDQFILRERVDVPASTVSTVKIDIPAGVQSVQFIITAEKFVGNSLIDPKKVVHESISANSSMAIEKYRSFFVEDPMAGTWMVEFTNRSPDIDSSSVVSVKVNDYVAQIDIDVQVVDENVVNIAALLRNDGAIVADTQIVAEIESQNQVSRRYTLYDDGQHADGVAQDGVFATRTDAFIPGGYFAVVRAALGSNSDEILSIASVYIEEKADSPY